MCFWSRTPFSLCSDTSETHLKKLLTLSSNVWLAVSDKAIESLIDTISPFYGPIFHLSGAHLSDRGIDVHFLGSFSFNLFEKSFYPKLSIITSHTQAKEILNTTIPQIQNNILTIKKEDKARYHAACVMAGPGTMTLWWQMESILKSIGLHSSVTNLYLETVFENWRLQKENALTGPWTRGDVSTTQNNLKSLDSIQSSELYQALVNQYQSLKSELK